MKKKRDKRNNIVYNYNHGLHKNNGNFERIELKAG